jgi:hypothetical protein
MAAAKYRPSSCRRKLHAAFALSFSCDREGFSGGVILLYSTYRPRMIGQRESASRPAQATQQWETDGWRG